MIKKLLAADIGGSKTRIQLLDVHGNILSEAVTSGVAYAHEDAAPLPPLENLLAAIEEKETVAAAAVNLGGKNTEQINLSFRKYFPDIPLKIFRESEGTAAYALGREFGAQIILMAGTGAIAVGSAEEKHVITGGWGAHIGDDGSGYDIGLQAIRMTLRSLDKNENLSSLAQFLSGWETPLPATADPAVFKDRRDRIRERLSPFDRRHIASLAKNVADFAQKGDESALQILRYAGESLADLVLNTAEKLDEKAPVLVVTGGLINIRQFWGLPFENAIRDRLPDAKIHYVTDGLLLGTRRIVMKLYQDIGGTDKL